MFTIATLCILYCLAFLLFRKQTTIAMYYVVLSLYYLLIAVVVIMYCFSYGFIGYFTDNARKTKADATLNNFLAKHKPVFHAPVTRPKQVHKKHVSKTAKRPRNNWLFRYLVRHAAYRLPYAAINGFKKMMKP